MKKILKSIVRKLPRILGPKISAKVIRNLAKGMTPDEFQSSFGFPQEVVRTPPGHYYSVIPDVGVVRERHQELMGKPSHGVNGIDFNLDGQYALSSFLGPLFSDFPYKYDSKSESVHGVIGAQAARYKSERRNETFHLDAVVLQAMLRHFKPRRVVEVGSGYSSAIMLDTRERFDWQHQQLTFIEPYSQEYFFPLLRGDDRKFVRLIEQPLWEVDDSVFTSLEPDDLLFIDSSHVAKIGSDVYHYLFNIFPLLKPGVIIHVHDITTWFEMAPAWFDRGWYWNEGQFLRAFLMYNKEFEILFHSSAMCWLHRDAPGINELHVHMKETFKLPDTQWSNSFYLRRK